jgi:hypothetical protein
MSRVLDEVRIASPCGVSWDDMIGTNRVRYCHHCRLNVYNLSALNRADAETMIQQRERRLCIRFYRRADGTMITQDCPVGVQAARWATHRGWVLLTASLASVLAVFVGVSAGTATGRVRSAQRLEPFASVLDLLTPSPRAPAGRPQQAAPECLMGEMKPPERVPEAKRE